MSDPYGDENLRPELRSPRKAGGNNTEPARPKLTIDEIRQQLKKRGATKSETPSVGGSVPPGGPPPRSSSERTEGTVGRPNTSVTAGSALSAVRDATSSGFYDSSAIDAAVVGPKLTDTSDPKSKSTPMVQASPPTQPRSSKRNKTQAEAPQTVAEALQSNDLYLIREKYIDLASLCEEVLTYCHLLDNSRNYTVSESLELRTTVRELEKLLTSARQREVEHLSHVDLSRESLATFEKKYYSLKSRARTHIRDCQEERDKLRKELDAAQSRLKVAEAELYAAQSLVHSQQNELTLLRDQTKDMPSEKEITHMSLKLRRLEDENGRLATERNKLIAQLDELQGGKTTTSKHVDQKLNAKEISEYQATIARLRKELAQQEKDIKQLKSENADYNEYITLLLEQKDQAN